MGSVSRILYGIAAVAIIRLGGALPRRSSDLPGRLANRAGSQDRAVYAARIHPSLFGLAPCGVCHATFITERPVRSYRTFSPLPRGSRQARIWLTGSPEAVCSLWHFPSDGLEAAAPGRYPAHRSVEFGLSSPRGALSGQAGVSPAGGDHPIPTLSSSIIQRACWQ